MAIEVEEQELPPGSFTEHDHMIGYSMCEIPGFANVMQIVYIRDGKPYCSRRIRIYLDDKVFNSADRRFFRVVTSTETITPEAWWEQCKVHMDEFVAEMPDLPIDSALTAEHHFVNGTVDEFLDHMGQRPWAHVDHERSARVNDLHNREAKQRN